MNKNIKNKGKLYIALFAVFVSIISMVVATFAWYIYNTSSRTTKVKLVAGTSVELSISNEIDGDYASNTILEDFIGRLNPVSTNFIQNDFQKVIGYSDGSEIQPDIVASIFGEGDFSDYYKTSIYIKTDGLDLELAISNIGYHDLNEEFPISTAIRVGFVVPSTGEEFIFSINEDRNPDAEYNTQQGEIGHVLDSTKTDGTTLKFENFTEEEYCIYNSQTGEVQRKADTISIMQVNSEPTQLDIYIWLEGCDEDCTQNLSSSVLKNLAISFCGMEINEGE